MEIVLSPRSWQGLPDFRYCKHGKAALDVYDFRILKPPTLSIICSEGQILLSEEN
mgnify:CR=1 FL=1